MTDRCRGCGAPIIWARTINGKTMPVDPDPHPDGNVRLNADGTCDVLGGGGLLATEQLHHTHFTTCPARARFRKAKA